MTNREIRDELEFLYQRVRRDIENPANRRPIEEMRLAVRALELLHALNVTKAKAMLPDLKDESRAFIEDYWKVIG